jgi:hypothetical protein
VLSHEKKEERKNKIKGYSSSIVANLFAHPSFNNITILSCCLPQLKLSLPKTPLPIQKTPVQKPELPRGSSVFSVLPWYFDAEEKPQGQVSFVDIQENQKLNAEDLNFRG